MTAVVTLFLDRNSRPYSVESHQTATTPTPQNQLIINVFFLNTVELQWLEHWWLVTTAFSNPFLSPLERKPVAADLE